MSGPKVSTYTPPPVVYFENDFNVGNQAETAETLAVLGKLSGVSITIRNGKIHTRYPDYSGWNESSLTKAVQDAKEQAAKNLAYVRQVKEATIRSLDSTLKKEEESFKNSLKNIDDAIARLEELKNRTSKPLETPSRTFTCDKEVKDIEKAIKKLRKERDDLIKEHEGTIREARNYRDLISRVVTTADLHNVQGQRPYIATLTVNPSEEVNEVIADINERTKVVKAYVDAVNQLYAFVDKENLGEYTIRLDDQVANLDPYNPKSIESLNKLIQDIIQEREFRLRDEEGRKGAQEDKDKVTQQLETLRKISNTLKPLIFKLNDQNETIVDVSEQNADRLLKVESIADQISKIDYISPQNHEILSNIKKQINLLKSVDLNKPRITVEIDKLLADASKLLDIVSKENEKYGEYQKALADYLSARTNLTGLSAEAQELFDLSKMMFNVKNAEELIAKLKADTEEMNRTIREITSRSLINSFAGVVGQDHIFKKEEGEGAVGFSYVREEDPGVLYVVEHIDRGTLITPRGVVLSNGQPVIDEEGLRKVHSSCDWCDELNDRLTKAGIPNFTAEEEPDEVREALYDIENYYHIETDEESIRYLRLCGFDDEQIRKFGYDVHTMSQIVEEDRRESHEEHEELYHDLDED